MLALPLAMITTVALAVMRVPSAAQSQPDFSGRWVLIGEGATDPTRALIVRQDETSLTVEDWSKGTGPVVYELNGAATPVTSKSAGTVSKASWKDRDLVIETTLTSREGGRQGRLRMIKRTETWSLTTDDRLAIRIVERREGPSVPSGTGRNYRKQ